MSWRGKKRPPARMGSKINRKDRTRYHSHSDMASIEAFQLQLDLNLRRYNGEEVIDLLWRLRFSKLGPGLHLAKAHIERLKE